MNKVCAKCKVEKPWTEFRLRSRYGNPRPGPYCFPCEREYVRERRRVRWDTDPEYRRRRLDDGNRWKREHRSSYGKKADLKKNYGITVEDYERMLQDQNGVCAICQNACPSGKNLAVDHDHETDRIRGLLCMNCNQGLGKFKDSPKFLKAAQEYLER